MRRSAAVTLGFWSLVKEVARHLLRRPVVGVAAAARTPDGRWLLVRRADSRAWALPGGTLEWGEPLRRAVERELGEEAGAAVLQLGGIAGVYSAPGRDARFHAVTIVVHATVSEPSRPPLNPLEIVQVRLFDEAELPSRLAHGMGDMLADARAGRQVWE
jgi:8-oxo-dGTP diphosphatase